MLTRIWVQTKVTKLLHTLAWCDTSPVANDRKSFQAKRRTTDMNKSHCESLRLKAAHVLLPKERNNAPATTRENRQFQEYMQWHMSAPDMSSLAAAGVIHKGRVQEEAAFTFHTGCFRKNKYSENGWLAIKFSRFPSSFLGFGFTSTFIGSEHPKGAF